LAALELDLTTFLQRTNQAPGAGRTGVITDWHWRTGVIMQAPELAGLFWIEGLIIMQASGTARTGVISDGRTVITQAAETGRTGVIKDPHCRG
jgi:hypothetical protein